MLQGPKKKKKNIVPIHGILSYSISPPILHF